jgi:dihydrodipicolinate synthase/N-acetylneuraminate lyase
MKNKANHKEYVSRRSFIKNMGVVSALSFSPAGAFSTDLPKNKTNIASTPYKKGLTGPCLSVRTPFNKDGSIDYEALRTQIDFSIKGGANAVILTYGDSLFSLLDDKEIADLTRKCVGIVKKRVMLVAATGQWPTAKTKVFAAFAAKEGADLLMVLPPDWAGSCTVETLVKHYAAAGEHIPLMIVDNYLGARPPAFALAVIKELYDKVPSVVAMKDDVTGELVRKICLMTYDRWALIAGGLKQNHINMINYGVDGYFSMHVTFYPDIARKYWNAIKEDRIDEAITIIRDYDMPFFDFIRSLDGGFDAGIHGTLEILGLGKRYRRLPYHSLTDEQMEKLRDFLKSKSYI